MRISDWSSDVCSSDLLLYLLETHAHADHLSAADYLRAKTGTPIMIGAGIRAVRHNFAVLFEIEDRDSHRQAFDGLLVDGDTLPLGSLHITILHTPGHTQACLNYVVGEAAFVGDTLLDRKSTRLNSSH